MTALGWKKVRWAYALADSCHPPPAAISRDARTSAPSKPLTKPVPTFVLPELPNPHKKTTDALSVDSFQPIFNKTYTDNLYAYNLFTRLCP